MAIAGIESAAFATSELGSMEDDITSITNNSMEPISLPSGTGLFTDEQVREILSKFANAKNAMRRDMPVDEIVDEFMEGDEE